MKRKLPETVIKTQYGTGLHAPAHPNDVTYVRVCDGEGLEIAYWSCEEWEEDPCGVMGAIVGALRNSPPAQQKKGRK